MADEDTAVEDTESTEDSEDSGDTEGGDDAEETPAEDTPADGHAENAVASAVKPSAGPAKVAALVAGAVLASAAAIVGAVWAITAITDDDDDYGYDVGVPYYAPDYEEGLYYEESVAPERSRRDRFGREPRADRDQRRYFDRDRRDRSYRDRDENYDRDSGKRTDRDTGEHKDGDRQESSESSEPSKPAAEECSTIHRFGSGENAVTILVCKAPGAEWRVFEPGEGGYFRFRKLPQDVFPYFGMGGEQWPFQGRQRPFGPGPMPWDRDGGPFEDRWPFRDGRPREGEPPFDLEEFFRGERFGDGELPFDLQEFFGGGELRFDLEEFLEERLDRGDRGFRFRGDGTGDGLCFQLGEEQEECIADLDQLSDEERAQIEQMLELLEDFGLGGFLDGLLDSLHGLEFEFPESQTDPSGATGA